MVFDAYRKGDFVAQKIIEKRLGVLLSTLERAAELYNGGCEVVFGGGLTKEREVIEKHLLNSHFNIHFADNPPIFGAANRCIRLICEPEKSFTKTFEKTYNDIIMNGEK